MPEVKILVKIWANQHVITKTFTEYYNYYFCQYCSQYKIKVVRELLVDIRLLQTTSSFLSSIFIYFDKRISQKQTIILTCIVSFDLEGYEYSVCYRVSHSVWNFGYV